MGEALKSVDEFLEGQRACQRGESCPVNCSEDFKRGYGAEYEREQILTEMTEWGFR